MNRLHKKNFVGKTTLPRISLLALAIAGIAAPVQAANFELGDFNLQVNSQISAGASFRTQSRENDYIAGGTLAAQGKTNPAAANASYQGNNSSNTDDGNMNFDQGDMFSQVISGNHELRFGHNQYRNFGANLSFRYWYDGALDGLNSPSDADMVDDWKGTSAYEDAKSGIELMDAYVYGDFDVAGRPAQILLGRHVLNWGESTFIQGGQNAANPVDVPALRRPGAEIRDALLPVAMISGSIALDEMGDFTLEGYYQFEWQRTRADACGSFFSNNDFAAKGCGPVYYQSGASEQANADGQPPGLLAGLGNVGLGEYVTIAERADDKEPSDTGQWGVALKWYAEQLNGTEFGLYFQNIHSRLPVAGGIVSSGTPAGPALAQSLGLPAGSLGDGSDEATRYQIDFPENMKVLGASFATLLPSGTAWSGEFTYRPDAPVQINANDVLVRGLLGNLGYDPAVNAAGLYDGTALAGFIDRLPSEIQDLEAGSQKGYREFDVFQFQSTFIHDINRVLAADNLRLIGEVGFTYVNDLPDTDEIRFGRSSIYGSWGEFQDDFNGTNIDPDKVFADNGYVTDFSWGYRLLAQLEYNNAFVGGLTLKPSFSWSHDVSGYGPEPGSQFYEGRMILGTELAAEYMNTYFGRIGYTHYFDTDYWDLDDRNFASISVGMNY
ncbi:Protein of unknown function [Marinospirillum celere]|uniref:DUF1302 domain-containing protein n=1 Tax=Marinospirillum celere TaxID=1122252 RepID=A0A1I1HY97_9GAMM|nr:DUF1302 domain-containing protein [Marinospirillum celere]SFC28542.1 Protein of unknown function [Marinospirillum celere]